MTRRVQRIIAAGASVSVLLCALSLEHLRDHLDRQTAAIGETVMESETSQDFATDRRDSAAPPIQETTLPSTLIASGQPLTTQTTIVQGTGYAYINELAELISIVSGLTRIVGTRMDDPHPGGDMDVDRTFVHKQTDAIYDSMSDSIDSINDSIDDTNDDLSTLTADVNDLAADLNALSASISSIAFVRGGNAFGTSATLGTTDTQPLSLITDGTERLIITADGKVGVGTSTPLHTLDVDGDAGITGTLTLSSSSANSILFADSSHALTTDGAYFTYDPYYGRLGINYDINAGTNPSTSPSLNPTDSFKGTVEIRAPHVPYQSNEAVLDMRSFVTGSGDTSELRLGRARGTEASPIVSNPGDYVGEVDFESWDGSIWHQNARMYGVIGSTWTPTSHEERINFRTTAASTTSTSLSMSVVAGGIIVNPTSDLMAKNSAFAVLSNGSIGPAASNTFDLGASDYYWHNAYANNVFTDNMKIGNNVPSDANYSLGILTNWTDTTTFNGLLSEPTYTPTADSSTTKKAAKLRIKANLTGQNLSSSGGGLIGVNASTEASGTGTIKSMVGGYFYNNFGTGTLNVQNAIAAFFWGVGANGGNTILNSVGGFFREDTSATNNINAYLGPATGAVIPADVTGDWSIYNASTRPNYFGGSLGIGTTSPSAKLDVWGTVNIATGTIPTFFADTSTGRVGIGTTTPQVPLHIQQPGSAAGFYLSRGGFTTAGLTISSAASSSILGIGNTSSRFQTVFNLDTGNVGIGTTTPTSLLSLAQGTTAANGINFGGDVNLFRASAGSLSITGGGNQVSLNTVNGYIYGEALSNLVTSNNALVRTNSAGTQISRNVADNAPALTVTQTNAGSTGDILRLANSGGTVLTVQQGGNFGIGTTTPSSKLSVSGNTYINGDLTATGSITFGNFNMNAVATCGQQYHTFIGAIGDVGGDQCAALNVTQQDTNGNVIYRFGGAGQAWAGEFYANSSLVGMNTKGGIPLSFQIGQSEKMRITAGGNIGIGTTSPSERLDVNGAVNVLTGYKQNGVTILAASSTNFATLVGIGTGQSMTSGQYITAVGYEALLSNTSGTHNSSVGFGALRANSTGGYNTALGSNALYANTSGVENTAVGQGTLQGNVSGSHNVAIGYRALFSSTASNNSALGYQALNKNLTGTSNTALGYQSLYNNTTGNYNTGNGESALFLNTGGNNNSGFGYQSLYNNTTGNNNTANGYQALRANTSGSDNTSSGWQALSLNTSGYSNVANGYRALRSNTTGYFNIADGWSALVGNTTGFSNIAIGYLAGGYIADGSTLNQISSNSLYLGTNSKALADGNINEIVIGDSAIGNGSNSVTLGNASITKTVLRGSIGIGTSTPSEMLTVTGSARFTGVASGPYAYDLNLTADGTLTTSASDRRLKTQEELLDTANTLEKLLALQPKSFVWRETNTKDIGLIAQEVEDVFPEIVFTNPNDGYMGINYSRLPALIIAGVQELAAKVTELFVRDEEQEGKIDRLEQQNDALNARVQALEAALNVETESEPEPDPEPQGGAENETTDPAEPPSDATGTPDDPQLPPPEDPAPTTPDPDPVPADITPDPDPVEPASDPLSDPAEPPADADPSA